MPLGDISDYSPALFVEGARTALRAREEMPWGKIVPEKIFKHFVLPLRVNNENLDGARVLFFDELKDRVSSMSMHDAALEVNHWCHEKVIYTPSDGRTSAPLATVLTAQGRCGEESVFTVTALRAVGIPARQVYTPRWAHTDDNHAWVEVWVDGAWHFIGACEPEAELDMAWFSSTVKRALLMHTKVFGRYQGDEDIINTTNCYTEINVTSNYTPTSRVNIKIVDMNGRAVEGAKVEFKIYNYAELYSAITTKTDLSGRTSATFGRGDIVVWASFEKSFGYSKVTVSENMPEMVITLDHKIGDELYQEIDIVPPIESNVATILTQEKIDYNNWRLSQEDEIREKYVSTFAQKDKSNAKIFQYLAASRGNWREISQYLNTLEPSQKVIGIKLLDLISAKDLRDTPASVLLDHLNGYDQSKDEINLKYVLNPRVSNELLTPWRNIFQVLAEQGLFGEKRPEDVIAFCNGIAIKDEFNPQSIPMCPLGVMQLRTTDSRSREIFFVALCRALNIPARIEEVGGRIQYYENGMWNNVEFSSNTQSNAILPKGTLTLTYDGQRYIDNPKFETHFTIAKIENGSINTLNFRDKEGYEGTVSWKSISREPIILEAGYYMLTTGTRLASGKVLSNVSFFNIKENEESRVKIVMRDDDTELQVIGSMNAESKYLAVSPDSQSQEEVTILHTTGRGYFTLLFVAPNHEPSNHAIRSFLKEEPSTPAIIFFEKQSGFKKFLSSGFPQAPEGVFFGIDSSNAIRNAICKEMKIKNLELPLIVKADTFGRIVSISQGYVIL